MVSHGSIHFNATDFFLPLLRLFFFFSLLSLGTSVQDIPGLGDDGYGTKTLSKFPGMVTVNFLFFLDKKNRWFCFSFFFLILAFVPSPKTFHPGMHKIRFLFGSPALNALGEGFPLFFTFCMI